jgi:hypothetical protein
MLNLSDVKRIQTETQGPVLSLYLNVNPGYLENQAANPAWRVWSKTALRDLEATAEDDQRKNWQAIRERAEAFLDDYRAESQGLVLFIGAETQEHYALPLTVENQAAFGEPLVTPLFWKLDEYERYLIVLVDQQDARFITAYLGSVGEEQQMNIDFDQYGFGTNTGSPEATGGDKDSYEAAQDEYRSRFYRSVVDRIGSLSLEHGTTRIILGGSDAVHAVRTLLSDQQTKQIVDQLSIPLKSAPHEIVKLAQPAAYEYERKFEAELLNGVIDLAKAGGRGALGRNAVMQALKEQRVDLVIAPWPLADEYLLATLPDYALNSGSTIELVHGEAAQRLSEEGGIAARLYYTV